MGAFRLLIWAGLAYVCYRVVKGVFASSERLDHRNDGVIDEMVQDPQCKTYVPRRGAERRVVGGREYFFCSKECADKFEEEMRH